MPCGGLWRTQRHSRSHASLTRTDDHETARAQGRNRCAGATGTRFRCTHRSPLSVPGTGYRLRGGTVGRAWFGMLGEQDAFQDVQSEQHSQEQSRQNQKNRDHDASDSRIGNVATGTLDSTLTRMNEPRPRSGLPLGRSGAGRVRSSPDAGGGMRGSDGRCERQRRRQEQPRRGGPACPCRDRVTSSRRWERPVDRAGPASFRPPAHGPARRACCGPSRCAPVGTSPFPPLRRGGGPVPSARSSWP